TLMDASNAEIDLWKAGHVSTGACYEERRAAGDYDSAIAQAVSLRPLLARFFDDVMVMVDDERIRANRLAILKTLYASFSTIADFSEIVTESRT
ncbi:MAG: glycine--tRNA ligase subunit beta, partial [Candidatus Sulfotelmatobacter sp.]